jgi:hypothetical protein
MMKSIFCLLLLATTAFAEIDKTQLDLFKKEAGSLRTAIDDVMMTTLPGRSMLDATKATYLEGYGGVFTLEASLEPTRSPFTSPKTPAEVRATVAQRRKDIETKLENLLKQRVGALQSIGPTESVTVVLYLLNSNPVDVPDLPSQILFTVKKEDPTQVAILPY